MRTRAWMVLVLIPFLATLACEDPPADRDRVVVAYVGNQPLYLNDVQAYFESNMIGVEPGDDLPAATIDEVKSRLLDAMIDEHILHAEAERRAVRVSDLEVATYLDMGAAETPDDAERRAWRELLARQRLMIQKLQEQVVRELSLPTDDEVVAYAEAHRDELIPSRPLELRALQIGSLEEAVRVQREIRSRRMTFNEAALAHEASPGQALPQRMSWEALSEDVRAVLEGLKPGDVSKPIELRGETYLFQIGTWLDDPADQDIELMHRAMQALEGERRREALDDLQRQLRSRSAVRLKEATLPFRYVPVAGRT